MHSPCGHLLQIHVRLLRVRDQIATASAAGMAAATATIDTSVAPTTVDPAAVAAVASAVAPSAVASAIGATQRTTSVASRDAACIFVDAIGRVVRRTWMAKA